MILLIPMARLLAQTDEYTMKAVFLERFDLGLALPDILNAMALSRKSIWMHVIRQKILSMITDPARRTRKDPGDPEKCSAYQLHKAYTVDRLDEVAERCRSAGWGCVEGKGILEAAGFIFQKKTKSCGDIQARIIFLHLGLLQMPRQRMKQGTWGAEKQILNTERI